MKQYQIGDFAYDHNTGKITCKDGELTSEDDVSSSKVHTISLRAKSNDVLLYFLRHPNQLLSKQDILQHVWDDVVAQEHVLFQSIKEIRQCFADLDVIKTHPRKGYEWIAASCAITPSINQATSISQTPSITQPPLTKNTKQQNPKAGQTRWLPVFAITLFIGMSLAWFFAVQNPTEPESAAAHTANSGQKPRFVELVITPVKIHNQQDNLTQWVPIGAMDMLIQKLQQTAVDNQTGGIIVVDTEDVLNALQRANARETENHELQSRQLRHNMGEITSLHAELFGSPMEYSLKYELINRYETRQGLLTGETVVELINQLARSLPELLQMKTTEPFVAYQQRFANDAFIFGLSHYYEHEFRKAADYFRTAIAAGDQFPQSRRFLASSIAAQGQFEQAIILAQEAVSFARAAQNSEEELRSLFELGVNQWRIGDFAQAKQNIKQTRTLAKQGKDLLYLAFSIEMLGHFALANEQLAAAQHYYSQALEYHKGFRCPYGLSTNYINLSRVAKLQGNTNQGNEFLNNALNIARQNELVYFETRIHLLMARASLAQNNPESVGLHLNFAQNLVNKHPNEGAQEVLRNWPESADSVY